MTYACSLADVLSRALRATGGMNAEVAEALACRIVRWGAENGYARLDYYWPAATPDDRRARDAAIRAEFNGRNLREVCRRYDVSPATVYRAARQVFE